MNGPHVTVSNVVAGKGAALFSCDVRVSLGEDTVLVIRDVRLVQPARGGQFVGWPHRLRHDGYYNLVDFEGAAASAIVEAIRAAMKAPLATPEEITEGGRCDDAPF